jgi:tripeptidyl-peptidase II
MKLRYLFIAVFIVAISIFAQETGQTFLSLKSTGVEEFLKLHPDYDGRGTIIIILDTGVDMGVEGMLRTSTGETKVVDVQDFTGQGDVNIYEADISKEEGKSLFFNKERGLSVKANIASLISSADNKYYIGGFPEKQLMNSGSGAADLNGNGNTDDVYNLITYKTNEEFWVVYFDTNADGDLTDEKPLRNYKESQDAFLIPNKKGLSPFTFGLNIFPEDKIVSLHFDDGSHGSHCAGIAAGYDIGGIGMNGVAPGAKVISLKLGNNNYTGGATVTESMKKSYLYADKLSKELGVPCIVSMSYGVGSEIEGRADIEKFLDDLLRKNPYLYVCVSNGNNGPGLSSAGLPSSSQSVFASGAVLTVEVGRDNYGAQLKDDIILHFSSRGGDTNKPDIISPGAATSTVPNFTGRDAFWGTSMASPYSAGVMALLLSAANKDFPGVKIPAQLLYRIVREGAVKWEGYNILDQGAGYINVMNAYELLKKYLMNGEHKKFESYTVTSFAPNHPDNRSQSLYLRDASYLTGEEVFTFAVSRNNIVGSDNFYRSYNLKSDNNFLMPVQKKTYIRNNQQAMINVKIDKSKITGPGLYTGRIIGSRDDGSNTPEFELTATIIVPFEFNSGNDYKLTFNNQKVDIGEVDRYFIKVPAGQNTLKLTKSRVDNTYCRTRMWIFDHDGIDVYVSPPFYSVSNDQNFEVNHYNLSPGIYEINVDGFFLAADTSNYTLSIELVSLQSDYQKVLTQTDNTINVTNNNNRVYSYNLTGEMIGYERKYSVAVDGSGVVRLPFKLIKGEASRNFEFTLSKEDFNKTTDFSVMILNEEGKALAKNGLANKSGSLSIKNSSDKDEVNYILEIIPAFTHKEGKATLFIKEQTEFPSAISVDVKDQNRKATTLYPSNPKSLKCSYAKPETIVPEDAKVYGKIYFKSPSTEKTEYELPIYFKF